MTRSGISRDWKINDAQYGDFSSKGFYQVNAPRA
jgi:hypothetical protein